MSSHNDRHSPTPADMSRRRGSITQATLSNLFQRSSSVSGASGTPTFPGALPMGDHRRRLSLTTSAGVGLTGTSPNSAFLRRASLSTSASELDENAIEEDDVPARGPFPRRMSFSTGPRNRGVPPSPNTNDQGFNWSEQLRSRAESLTSRPILVSNSPPRGIAPAAHERAKSVGEMAPPPAQATTMRPPHREISRKPDAFQERILKGDFYMD